MKVKIIALFVMAFMALGSCTAFAHHINPYQTYLNGDPNFIMCGAHMGVACYVKKSSVVVQNYDPPNFEIYVETIVADFQDYDDQLAKAGLEYKLGKLTSHLYRYNSNSMRMIEYLPSEGKWHYIKPVGSMAETGHWYPGEMAYYIAFHQKFYGSRQWLVRGYDGTYRYETANCAISDGLYEKVDNADSVQ